MQDLAAWAIIFFMTRPVTASKLVLVEDRRDAPEEPLGAVRRYRLVRLPPDGRSSEQASRFEHLKRVDD